MDATAVERLGRRIRAHARAAVTHDRARVVHERAAQQAASVSDFVRQERELRLAKQQQASAQLEGERSAAAEADLAVLTA